MEKNKLFIPFAAGVGLYIFFSGEKKTSSGNIPSDKSDANKKAHNAYYYIKDYYPFAKETQDTALVPALFTLAQGALESNFGKSILAEQANNHFGIKADPRWTGEIYTMPSDTHLGT